jgi:hypothetical protein
MNSKSFREAFPDAFQRYKSARKLGRPKTKPPGGARTSSSSGRSSRAAAAASPSKQRTSGDKKNVRGRVRTAEEVAAFVEMTGPRRGGGQGPGQSGEQSPNLVLTIRRSVSTLRIETEEEDTTVRPTIMEEARGHDKLGGTQTEEFVGRDPNSGAFLGCDP